MPEIYSSNGNRMDRRDRKPGVTLAESLGIDVPTNAPGGAKVAAPSIRPARRTGFDAWATSEEYEGFSDPDGWGRGDAPSS